MKMTKPMLIPPLSTRTSLSASKNMDSEGESKTTVVTTYEVCLSPGCIADGAQVTLQKLQALVPYSSSSTTRYCVKAGVCQSLCGNGPIVRSAVTNRKTRQVSSDDKMLKLLGLDGGVQAGQKKGLTTLLQSFDCVREASGANDVESACRFYQQAIDSGLSIIQGTDSYSLEQVLWLVDALQKQTQLLLKDPTGMEKKQAAVEAAEKAVELVRNATTSDDEELSIATLYSCLECLQQALEACNDKNRTIEKEVDVIQRLLKLLPKKLTATQQNKRRTLGFRLQKLQQMAGQP
jgi:hypothetical protein